jgi:hypothetical protein
MSSEIEQNEQIELINKKMQDEYRALMNYVETKFITSYKRVNSTVTNITNKMREIMNDITKMNGLFVKCPDIISSNILGLDLNKKLESLGIMATSIMEEYNEIVRLAEEKNLSLQQQSQTISFNITSIVKSYNGVNFFVIAEQLESFVVANENNTKLIEKYISDLEACGQTINQIKSDVENIITIPLAIKQSLQNMETDVLKQYSNLVDMQIREANK